jgi:hypothetical protein
MPVGANHLRAEAMEARGNLPQSPSLVVFSLPRRRTPRRPEGEHREPAVR